MAPWERGASTGRPVGRPATLELAATRLEDTHACLGPAHCREARPSPAANDRGGGGGGAPELHQECATGMRLAGRVISGRVRPSAEPARPFVGFPLSLRLGNLPTKRPHLSRLAKTTKLTGGAQRTYGQAGAKNRARPRSREAAKLLAWPTTCRPPIRARGRPFSRVSNRRLCVCALAKRKKFGRRIEASLAPVRLHNARSCAHIHTCHSDEAHSRRRQPTSIARRPN